MVHYDFEIMRQMLRRMRPGRSNSYSSAMMQAANRFVTGWSLDEAERRAIGTDLLRTQWRWPLGIRCADPWGTGCGNCGLICRAAARRVF